MAVFILCTMYFPTSIFFSKSKNKTFKNWLVFGLLTATIALPLFYAISSQGSPLKHLKFAPGWTSKENIVWFWFKNLGLFGPLLIISLAWLYRKNKNLFLIYLPFLIIFVVCNIFVFQPWNFDNSKLLIYWYFASSIVIAYFLRNEFFRENNLKKFSGTVIVILLIFSSVLDIFRTFTPITYYKIFSNQDLQIADSVKNLTPKDAIFLTAPIHNHPVSALSGRSTLLGFYGWVWSHGLNYQERADDINRIYQGDQNAEQLISKYRISYITDGPYERSNFDINRSFLSKFPQIFLDSDWRIYDVSNIWSHSNGQN